MTTLTDEVASAIAKTYGGQCDQDTRAARAAIAVFARWLKMNSTADGLQTVANHVHARDVCRALAAHIEGAA